MKFSSPYNTTDSLVTSFLTRAPVDIEDKQEFYAMDEKGNVYHVIEHFKVDKRAKKGYRFCRDDKRTGKSLFGIGLVVMLVDYDDANPMRWMLSKVTTLLVENAELTERLESLERRVESNENDFLNHTFGMDSSS